VKACLLATSAMVALGLAAEPVIRTDYHLTARPWKPLNTSQERYLDAIEGICRFSIRHQDASGAIIDPILKRKQLLSVELRRAVSARRSTSMEMARRMSPSANRAASRFN